jgi:hypothetical protein
VVIGDFDGEPRIFGRIEDKHTSEIGRELYAPLIRPSIAERDTLATTEENRWREVRVWIRRDWSITTTLTIFTASE